MRITTSRQKMTIQDLLDMRAVVEIQDGNHGEKHPKVSDYVNTGIPFIMARDILDNNVNLTSCKFIPKEQADTLRVGFAKTGDVLLTHKGTVGSVAIVPEVKPYIMLTPQVTYYRVNQNKLSNKYLAYAFRTPHFQAQLQLVSTQSTRPYIGITAQRLLEVTWVPLPIQRKIAAILSAYDDLIENNTRRITLLEQMAQALYREWFVHFRFPGHEDVPLVDSSLGPIPVGWEAVGYDVLLESYLGGGWGPEEPNEKESCPAIIIRGTDFDDVRLGNELRTPIRHITKSSLEKRRLREGDVIVENSVNASSRCVGSSLLVTGGVLNRVRRDTIAASFCKVFRPKEPEIGILIHLHLKHLRSEGLMEFYQNVATNGIGNFQARRFVASESIPIPSDKDLLVEMLSILKDLTTSNYAERNANLRCTRDLLLPRLISGQLDVCHLPIVSGRIG